MDKFKLAREEHPYPGNFLETMIFLAFNLLKFLPRNSEVYETII